MCYIEEIARFLRQNRQNRKSFMYGVQCILNHKFFNLDSKTYKNLQRKKSCPFLYSEHSYTIGQFFLDIM